MRRGARRAARATAAALLVALGGCAVGPDFVRPEPAHLPPAYRAELAPAEATSFADLPWWEVFADAPLRDLIREALDANYDLRTAVARVEEARHFVGVARAPLFPSLGYEGSAGRGRTFITAGFPSPTTNVFLGAFNFAWEIDVWGRIRRATEQAEAQLYAIEDIRRGVVLSLVAQVAIGYFTLQELDAELEIARRTTESFDDTVALFTRRFTGGVDSKLSVERARAARAQAAAAIPDTERQIVIQENALAILLGRPPGPIARTPLLTITAVTPETPPGLPAELLQRRPDILQAEQELAAQSARIGVATADFFPRLGLTALYGGQSSELEQVFKGSGNVWAISGSLLGPLFQGGALIENLRAADAGFDGAYQQYQQRVLTALAEVSNALVSRQQLERVRAEQALEVEALRESVRLATLRYVGGLSTYYEVLEAQQQLFPAELRLAQTDLARLAAVVDLYRALGGGWQADDVPVEVGFWPTGP